MAEAARPLLRYLARALAWGASWGAAFGAVEAARQLTSWTLEPSTGAAVGFSLRALVYGAAFFGLWTLAVAGAALALPAVRRWAGDEGEGAGSTVFAGAVAAGAVLLYGGVTWRVAYHINDPWSAPALWGGLLGIALAAAVVGGALALLARRVADGLAGGWWWPLPLVPLLLLVPLLGARDAGEGLEGPRVLLVTLDTFRADRVGAAGGPVETPALDGLAARGVLFEQAVAQAPITCPSHLSILSGVAPTTHGVYANGTRIPDDLPLLQETFADAGLPTAAFVAGYPVTARFGFDRGFGVFDDDFSEHLGDHRLTVRRLVDQVQYARGAPRERTADPVLRRAEPWLRARTGGFFCWVHLFDPHGPYDAPEPFGGSIAGPLPAPVAGPEMPPYWPRAFRAVADPAYWVRRYDEEIAYTDDALGRLLRVLDDEGIGDRTLVVVVGDHGESLTEHEYYFDHGLHLYDTSLRIPLVLAGPGIEGPRRVPCQVRGMDVAPTVLELAGMDPVDGVEGESLVPLWVRGCPTHPRTAVAATVEPPWLEDPGPELALRTDGEMRYKVVRHRRSPPELYDLRDDPEELRDVAGQHPEVEAWLAGQLDRIAEGMPQDRVILPADVEAQLRALGYITDGPRREDADDDSATERPEEDR